MVEIVTIGEIVVEIMSKKIGQKFNEISDYIGPFPSGAPAIFIDQAAKCESSSMIISAVGNDGFGDISLKKLKKDGVDINQVRVLDDESTGVAFVTYKEDGDRDFIFHLANAACGKINKKYLNEEIFKECKYFHIMGSSIYNDDIKNTIKTAIELAKKNNCKITFDPNVRKEIVTDYRMKSFLLEILYESQIILAGENELVYLTNNDDEQRSIDLLLDKKAEIIIIKRGSKGTTLYTKKYKKHIQPYKVVEIDPTGAGDCFAGTFVSCINNNIEVIEATKLANIAGALAVTKKGPMEGNTSLNDLKKILKKL